MTPRRASPDIAIASGVPDDVGAVRQDAGLSARQRMLFEALVELDGRAAEMYMGAIVVLSQAQNPDRVALCAHGLRELMEKLPRYLELPVVKSGGGLRNRLQQLAEEWRRLNLALPVPAKPDGRTQRFLARLAAFFALLDEEVPTRKEPVAKVLKLLDPTKDSLPRPIASLRVEEWDQCHRTFEMVSHHSETATLEELLAWIDVLDRFLLDHLRPRTFEDHAELDRIIQEGEDDAKA